MHERATVIRFEHILSVPVFLCGFCFCFCFIMSCIDFASLHWDIRLVKFEFTKGQTGNQNTVLNNAVFWLDDFGVWVQKMYLKVLLPLEQWLKFHNFCFEFCPCPDAGTTSTHTNVYNRHNVWRFWDASTNVERFVSIRTGFMYKLGTCSHFRLFYFHGQKEFWFRIVIFRHCTVIDQFDWCQNKCQGMILISRLCYLCHVYSSFFFRWLYNWSPLNDWLLFLVCCNLYMFA